jgi:hypothetical protein
MSMPKSARKVLHWYLSPLNAAFMSLTSYIPAYKNLREMESIIIDLASGLREEANAYDSGKLRGFSASRESNLLQSAQKLGPLRVSEQWLIPALSPGWDTLDYLTNLVISGWISKESSPRAVHLLHRHLLTSSRGLNPRPILVSCWADREFPSLQIYVPLLWISFRGLYEGSAPPEKVEAAPSLIKRLKKTPLHRKLNRDRRRLVCHALCVYVSTALHLPPLIILVSFQTLPECWAQKLS